LTSAAAPSAANTAGHPKHAAIDADEVILTFARIKHEHNQNRHYGSEVQYLSVDFREPHYGDD